MRVRRAGPAIGRDVQPSRSWRTKAVEVEGQGQGRFPASFRGADRRCTRTTSSRADEWSCRVIGRLRRCVGLRTGITLQSNSSLPVDELPDDAPAGDASASTGLRKATPMNEEMASLFEEIELQDMIDVDDQSAAASADRATISSGGGAPG